MPPKHPIISTSISVGRESSHSAQNDTFVWFQIALHASGSDKSYKTKPTVYLIQSILVSVCYHILLARSPSAVGRYN